MRETSLLRQQKLHKRVNVYFTFHAVENFTNKRIMIVFNLQNKYALAVSGGVDSMVMLHKFATLSARPDFYVVTVNHAIRTEAASDCQFVADYCAQLGVECRVFDVDAPGYCQQNKLSLETGARILRYQVLDSLDADYVCLAHNANDNAETVLMHILRGSGAKGAIGIKRVSGKYLRPMLDLTRNEIEQYAKDNNVPYVTDSTNFDTKYTRNFIRHNVMPLFTELNNSAQANILRFASNIAQDDAFLDSLADVTTVQFANDKAIIPLNLLLQPAPIAYRVLNKVFDNLHVFYDIEKTHFDAIIALASGNGGKRVNLPFNYVATNDYSCVTIEKNVVESAQDFEILFKLGRTVTPMGTVEVSSEYLPESLRIDVNAIPSNAVFRIKRDGDVFTKFGGGTKPLRKYLIDKKIPQRERNQLLLIADGNDVLVICGVEISDKVKVAPNSTPYYVKFSKN